MSLTSAVNSYSSYSNQVNSAYNTKTSNKTATKATTNTAGDTEVQKTSNTNSVQNANSTSSANYGKTIGTPQLSEHGQKYYEQLKKQFGNMDFILVSSDMKATAQAQASSYANASKMVVLIDEDKIERMATDSSYRKQYEGIIKNAASGVQQLKTTLQNSGTSNVKGYGAQVNDGGTLSFFAVLKKSSAAQKQRIEKKTKENKEAKKAAEKKAKEQEKEDSINSGNANKTNSIEKTADTNKTNSVSNSYKAAESDKTGKADGANQTKYNEDTVTITASSIEELMQKIQDYNYAALSDNVQTNDELKIGQSVDFKA